jgi:cytochrome c peroxidase
VTRPLAIVLLFVLATLGVASGASLQIEITPKFAGEEIQLASLRYKTSTGERFSITRVSYLASDFALQRADGSWLELSNSVAWLDAAQNRNTLRLPDIPVGEYRSIRFTIGLNPELNHADPAKFPAGHPLNPNLNSLHWNWQGGYIFCALEGLWRNATGQFDGWSYHLARDGNAIPVTLATPLEISNQTKLEIDFDIAALLNSPQPISFARDGTSTHSRDGDPILAALKTNFPKSFRVHRVQNVTEKELAAESPKPLYLPKTFAPYPFQMSATFPMPALPPDNPLIKERVALGEKLFHETALSKDRTISCAVCHQEKAAFSDPRQFSLGVENRVGTRHAMPFNLAWHKTFFWDGRAPTLRGQAVMPIQNHAEMDENLTNVTARLAAASYSNAFEAAFGSPEITPEKIGLALEQYLLTLTSFDSKFDRVMSGAEKFTLQEQRGFQLFSTEYDPRRGQYGADCFHCHGGPLFQSQTFANNGLDADYTRTGIDTGRAQVTGKKSDEGKFAVPSLRNVELTGPYMHDGRLKTLEEVVEHYCTGVQRSPTLDPNLAKHPNGGVPLSKNDQAAIVAFLKTLTDPKFLVGAE